MFKEIDQKKTETIIGPTVKVKGDFKGSGSVVVEGQLDGSLKTDQDLKIGPNAIIQANVWANNADVAGQIKGNIKLKGKIILEASAKITGDIDCQEISVASGAKINGNILMGEPALAKKEVAEKK